MLNMILTILYFFVSLLNKKFARYAKYDTYYTNKNVAKTKAWFARYAKYDTYYT